MRKIVLALMLIAFMVTSYSYAVAGNAQKKGHGEPAPNSGDGIPDGPGW